MVTGLELLNSDREVIAKALMIEHNVFQVNFGNSKMEFYGVTRTLLFLFDLSDDNKLDEFTIRKIRDAQNS